MPFSRVPPVATFVLVLAFVAGCASLSYARWARPMFDADRALAAGDAHAALAAYSVAEKRFGRFLIMRQVFASQYNRAVYNQLALLYQAGNYDAVLEKAASAPAGSSPHFWSGLALLTRAIAEDSTEARLVELSRAEEELKQALQAAPADWDTKFNYEIAARLAADLRREPKKKTDAPMQLLRPQPTQARPARRVG
jgi:tetratricopeptide (TPR) repeat protein